MAYSDGRVIGGSYGMTPLGAVDTVEYDCYYQGGAALLNQSSCPLDLNGEPLLYKESRLVTNAAPPDYKGFLLLLFLLWLATKQKQRT